MTYQYYFTSLGDKYIKIEHGDGTTTCVPNDPNNSDYAEIMRQVEAGELTIQDADAPE